MNPAPVAGIDHWSGCWAEHHECALVELERAWEVEHHLRILRDTLRYERRRLADARRVLADKTKHIEQLEQQVLGRMGAA